MWKVVNTGIVLLVLSGFRPAEAQTYSCEPATGVAAIRLRSYMVRLTGGDPTLDQTRQLYQLPVASSSSVQIVTQSKTCKDAAIAYHAAVRGASQPAISRRVAVVKVGNSRYVVIDPAEQEGEYQVTVIFDNGFRPLTSFNS